MSATHTDGPWIAAEAVSSVVGLPVVRSGEQGGRLICNVNCAADPVHGKVAGDDAFNREALANARLIAAAPEMLSALKSVVVDYDECVRIGMIDMVVEDYAIALVRAAVAKAEGQS